MRPHTKQQTVCTYMGLFSSCCRRENNNRKGLATLPTGLAGPSSQLTSKEHPAKMVWELSSFSWCSLTLQISIQSKTTGNAYKCFIFPTNKYLQGSSGLFMYYIQDWLSWRFFFVMLCTQEGSCSWSRWDSISVHYKGSFFRGPELIMWES